MDEFTLITGEVLELAREFMELAPIRGNHSSHEFVCRVEKMRTIYTRVLLLIGTMENEGYAVPAAMHRVRASFSNLLEALIPHLSLAEMVVSGATRH